MHVSTDSHLTDEGSTTCLTFPCIRCWISFSFCYIARLNLHGVYFPFVLFKIINVLTCLLGSKVKSVSNTVYLDKNIVQLLQLHPKAITMSSHDSCAICSKSYNSTVVIPLYRAFFFQILKEGILNASSSAVDYSFVSQKWGISRAGFWIDIIISHK